MRPFLVLSLSISAFAGSGTAPATVVERRKVLIDQDAFEIANLHCILMLLQDPSTVVVGITAVSGDGWAPEETAETLRMRELMGRTDVPAAQGAIFPLVDTQAGN